MRTIPKFSDSRERRKPGPKAACDYVAAARLRELREERGLSPNGLARQIRLMAEREGWTKATGPGGITEDTLARIERDGHCPSLRKQLVVSLFFGCRIRDIWDPLNRVPVREQTA